MIQIKGSFIEDNSTSEESDKDKKQKKYDFEFGAVIGNDPQNYPNTGDWKVEIPIIDKGTCIGCGNCQRNCPEAVIEMKQEGEKKKPVIDLSFCKGCGVCSQVCPVKAISMKNKDKK